MVTEARPLWQKQEDTCRLVWCFVTYLARLSEPSCQRATTYCSHTLSQSNGISCASLWTALLYSLVIYNSSSTGIVCLNQSGWLWVPHVNKHCSEMQGLSYRRTGRIILVIDRWRRNVRRGHINGGWEGWLLPQDKEWIWMPECFQEQRSENAFPFTN